MAARRTVFRRLPVVVVLGSTGTGKSKLAIEIAKKVGGEIISADSMQVYKGLDIVTNKVTAKEMSECPHHMLGFVSPPKEFSVVEYRNMALPLIHDIKKRGKIPIIVGGTNYYIESLLWDVLIDQPEKHSRSSDVLQDSTSSLSGSDSEEENRVQMSIKKRKQIQGEGLQTVSDEKCPTNFTEAHHTCRKDASESFTSQDKQRTEDSKQTGHSSIDLYEQLKEIDPAMAERIHPNDKRKIARSLQVFQQSGVQHSELISQQQQKLGGSAIGGPLRFDSMCVFWIQCDREILNERLDKRVDEMLQRGLLEELFDFHAKYNKMHSPNDNKRYTEGIFQSIGFKEFHKFLIQSNTSLSLDDLPEENKRLLENCIDNMKVITRRYAKKQITWVRNRFLGRPEACAPDVYGLDATDLDNWKTNVLDRALIILENIIEGCESSIEPLPRISVNYSERKLKYVCQLCDNRIIMGKENWQKHLVSRSHKWHVKRNKRMLEQN